MARLWLMCAYHGVYINLTVVDLSDLNNITIQVANMPANLIPEGHLPLGHIQEIQLARLSAGVWDFFWPLPDDPAPYVRNRSEAPVPDTSPPQASTQEKRKLIRFNNDDFGWSCGSVAAARNQAETPVPGAPPPQASVLQGSGYSSDAPRRAQGPMEVQRKGPAQRPLRPLLPQLPFPSPLPRPSECEPCRRHRQLTYVNLVGLSDPSTST